jgi:hypothetical protein
MADLNGDTIRSAREAAGWSISEAVRELRRRSPDPLPDTTSLVRSWKRWERGTTPSRLYRPLLAELLGLDEPAPMPVPIDLAGAWWAAWQSSRDRNEVLAVQPVQFWQQGDHVRMKALRRGRPIAEGGYLWHGEMRLWDNEILMGWYAADDGSVRSKGTVYLVLNPQGRRMTGRWVGLSWDGDTVTGLAAMARTEEETRMVIGGLIEEQRRGRDL